MEEVLPKMKKFVLVFKKLKLVFKTPKLPCPAFSLQGLGWIPHKKKPNLFSFIWFYFCLFQANRMWCVVVKRNTLPDGLVWHIDEANFDRSGSQVYPQRVLSTSHVWHLLDASFFEWVSSNFIWCARSWSRWRSSGTRCKSGEVLLFCS